MALLAHKGDCGQDLRTVDAELTALRVRVSELEALPAQVAELAARTAALEGRLATVVEGASAPAPATLPAAPGSPRVKGAATNKEKHAHEKTD